MAGCSAWLMQEEAREKRTHIKMQTSSKFGRKPERAALGYLHGVTVLIGSLGEPGNIISLQCETPAHRFAQVWFFPTLPGTAQPSTGLAQFDMPLNVS